MRKQRASTVLRGLEMRSTGKGHSLTGYLAVFDSDSSPLGGGKYVETIAPGTFARSLQSPPSGRQTLVIDHDDARIIGATNDSRGTRFVEDRTGLFVDAPDLPDTTEVRDLRELADAGLLSGMSFEFVPTANGVQTLDGGKRRRLTDVRLYHGTVLTGKQPAYPATTVEVRALAANAAVNADLLGLAMDAIHEGRRMDDDEFRALQRVAVSLAPDAIAKHLQRYSESVIDALTASVLASLLCLLSDEADDPGSAQVGFLKTAIGSIQSYIDAAIAEVGTSEDVTESGMEAMGQNAHPRLDAARALLGALR